MGSLALVLVRNGLALARRGAARTLKGAPAVLRATARTAASKPGSSKLRRALVFGGGALSSLAAGALVDALLGDEDVSASDVKEMIRQAGGSPAASLKDLPAAAQLQLAKILGGSLTNAVHERDDFEVAVADSTQMLKNIFGIDEIAVVEVVAALAIISVADDDIICGALGKRLGAHVGEHPRLRQAAARIMSARVMAAVPNMLEDTDDELIEQLAGASGVAAPSAAGGGGPTAAAPPNDAGVTP